MMLAVDFREANSGPSLGRLCLFPDGLVVFH